MIVGVVHGREASGWTPFRMEGRELEWQVTDVPQGNLRYLHIRSRDGRFKMRATVLDDVFALVKGRIGLSIIEYPLVLGDEFPLGQQWSECPYHLSGNKFEVAMYGIIHTELVRSLIGRWTHRRRYRVARSASALPATPPATGFFAFFRKLIVKIRASMWPRMF